MGWKFYMSHMSQTIFNMKEHIQHHLTSYKTLFRSNVGINVLVSNVSNLKHSSESVGQVPVQSFEHVGDVLSFCTTASLEKEANTNKKPTEVFRVFGNTQKNYAVLIQDGSFIFIPKLPGIILVPWYLGLHYMG